MIYLISLFFYFILLFIIFFKNRITRFLIGLHLIVSFLGIFLFNIDFLRFKHIEVTMEAFIIYTTFHTLFILAIAYCELKISRTKDLVFINLKSFKIISSILITINFLPSVFILGVLQRLSNYSSSELKQNIITSTYHLNNIIENFGLSMLGYFSDTYFICIFFLFIGLIKFPELKIFNFLLILSSCSTICNGLLVSGRTQIIYWIFSYLTFLYVFSPFLNRDLLKRLRKISFYLSLILIGVFGLITVMRFNRIYSDATEFAELISLVEYGGQSFLNFNYYMNDFVRNDYTFGRITPYLNDIFLDKFVLKDYRDSLNIHIGNFASFIGDIYIDIGIFGLGIFTIFFIFLLLIISKTFNKSGSVIYLLIINMMFNMPIKGIFYYPYYTKTSINAIFISILIIFLFKAKKTNDFYNYN